MNFAAVSGETGSPAGLSLAPPGKFGNKAFRLLTWLMAMMVLALLVLLGWTLQKGSALSLTKFGWDFFAQSDWNPVSGNFGAYTFIFGTFVSSFVGLLIALPLSLGTAVYLTELAPGWVRQPAISMIEMLAAIPSVVFGLWGMRRARAVVAERSVSAAAEVFGFSAVLPGSDSRAVHALRRRSSSPS